MTSGQTNPSPARPSDWPGSSRDWVRNCGTIDEAVAYAGLFWPDFVTHDGCIFLEFDETAYREWMNHTGGDRQAVEATMNHRHIRDLVAQQHAEPTREQLVQLGRFLKQMWESKLRRDFPDRVIVVSFPEDGCENLADYEITFFQETSPAAA
jgi:hypothetical protein